MAAQRERILVAGGQLADGEQAGQRLQLVGQRDDHADVAARQRVAGEARLVVVFDGVGDVVAEPVVQRVVAAHDALQLGELADHVGQQVGLGQLRGLRRPARASASPPSCGADRLGDGAHALDALALRAQLVVVDHLRQAGDARCQRLLAVLVEEELGVGQARAHHALVAADHRARVLRADVADHQEAVGQLALRVEQRKVLLVGLHREDQAFLRHFEELRLELADQHVRALDQRRDFVEQRLVVDRPARRRRPARRPRRSWRTISARRASKLAITAPSLLQRRGVAVGIARC